jgi:hypothetical protein
VSSPSCGNKCAELMNRARFNYVRWLVGGSIHGQSGLVGLAKYQCQFIGKWSASLQYTGFPPSVVLSKLPMPAVDIWVFFPQDCCSLDFSVVCLSWLSPPDFWTPSETAQSTNNTPIAFPDACASCLSPDESATFTVPCGIVSLAYFLPLSPPWILFKI